MVVGCQPWEARAFGGAHGFSLVAVKGWGMLLRVLPVVFVLLWSTGFLGAKFGLPYAEPLTFLSIRYALVIVLMTAIAVVMRAPWPTDRQQILHIGVSGLLIHALYLGGVFIAIGLGLPAGVTALVVGLQPLLTALGAGWLLGDHISRRQWLGLSLGFIGVVLVVSAKQAGDHGIPFNELAWMLLPAVVALCAITFGTLYQKRFCSGFDLRTGSVIQFVPCLVVTLAAAACFETMQVTWSGEFIFAVGWLVLVLSVGAISLLNVLIRNGSAVHVASLFYLTPPATTVLAWLLFGETLPALALGGMAVAVLGVWLARQR